MLKNILTKEILLVAYADLRSITLIAKKFGITRQTAARHLDEYGVEHSLKTKYKCNESFFATDTEQSFYLAGFIGADGCIKHKAGAKNIETNILSIGLSNKDRDFLVMLRDLLGAENPIKDFDVKSSKYNPKWKDTKKSEFTITSRQLCSDLARFNITERKSLTLEFPEWMKDHSLRHHFIRGYNDGDGSFYSAVSKTKKVKQVFFSLRGTPKFLTSLRSVFEKDLGLEERTKEIRTNNNCGVLEYGGNRLVKKIAEYLYKDATICLERKKEAAFAFKDYDTKQYVEDLGITKEQLEESYFRTKSIFKTSEEFKISSTSILNKLHEFNIPMFKSNKEKRKEFFIEYDYDDLKKSYYKHGTITGVAKEFAISKTRATRYLAEYKII